MGRGMAWCKDGGLWAKDTGAVRAGRTRSKRAA
jgi:hypothetical protein